MIFMTSIMGAPWSSQCFWDFTLTKLHSGKDTGMGQAISVPLSPVTEFVIYSIEKLYFGHRQFWAIFIHPNEMFLGEFVTCVGRTSCFRRDNSCSIPMRWKASRGVENIVNFKEMTCACLLWMVQFRSFLLQDHQDQYRNIQRSVTLPSLLILVIPLRMEVPSWQAMLQTWCPSQRDLGGCAMTAMTFLRLDILDIRLAFFAPIVGPEIDQTTKPPPQAQLFLSTHVARHPRKGWVKDSKSEQP